MKTLEEQLEGKRKPTQFGRLMEELGITSILSRSPQSRGRIERLWEFLPRYSQRFSVPAVQPGSAYRSPEEGFIPDEVFCFKYYRRVDVDNVVCFGGHRLQIEPTNGRASYARARVRST